MESGQPTASRDRPKLAVGYLTLRFTADVFPRFSSISYSICCPSLSVLNPARSTAETSHVAARPRQTASKAPADCIGNVRENDGMVRDCCSTAAVVSALFE